MGAKNETIKYLDFKSDAREDLEPHFAERFPGKHKFNVIYGNLIDAQLVEKVFTDETVNKFVITLTDRDGETDVIDFSHSEATYSFLASLAGINRNKPVKITVRKQTNKEGFSFARIDVIQDDVRVPWKIDVREKLPEGTDRRKWFEEFFNNNIATSKAELVDPEGF